MALRAGYGRLYMFYQSAQNSAAQNNVAQNNVAHTAPPTETGLDLRALEMTAV